jgi:hypothetical protein
MASHFTLVGYMPFNILTVMVLAILGFFFMAVVPCAAQQQANLSDIGNATVTLYYYDNENGIKGAIVPMPDNPQQVNYDTALAAPGMYAFSHVPAGQWYYLEADHNGNRWYAIFYMEENVGTKTANVHIPPLVRVNATQDITISPSPTATATPAASIPIPMINEGPRRATPGMTLAAAMLAAAIAMSLMAFKRR